MTTLLSLGAANSILQLLACERENKKLGAPAFRTVRANVAASGCEDPRAARVRGQETRAQRRTTDAHLHDP
jgi:hypothetical protein